jgi:hypothetical protein
MTMLELRKLSRQFWPNWSRRQRARWVRAKLIAPDPKVGTRPEVLTDDRNYHFARGVTR